MAKKSERRIVVVKKVARRFLEGEAKAEFRLKVYHGHEIKNLAGLLRSFRDGKIVMAGVMPLPDLGLKEAADSIEFWSGNRESLLSLEKWFTKRNYLTTGLW
jgi:hypothetical protein